MPELSDTEKLARLLRLQSETQQLFSLWQSLREDYLNFNPSIKQEHVNLAYKKYMEKSKEYQAFRKEIGLPYLEE